MIRLQLQHLLVMNVAVLLNWAGVCLGNLIYLYVAIVLGISRELGACTDTLLVQPS